MRKLLVVALGCMLFTGVGCQNQNDDMDRTDKKSSMSAKDACDHCPGVQTAKSDGSCPMCGAKAKM